MFSIDIRLLSTKVRYESEYFRLHFDYYYISIIVTCKIVNKQKLLVVVAEWRSGILL